MSQPTITTRAGKGLPLTYTEVDSNFTNLQSATVGITDGTNSGTLNLNDQLTITASGSASVVYNPSTKTLTVGGGSSLPSNAAGYLANDGSGNLSWATVSSGYPTASIYFNANMAYSSGQKACTGVINQIFSNISSLSVGRNSYNWNSNGSVSNVPYITLPAGSYQILIPAYYPGGGSQGTLYFGDINTNNQLTPDYGVSNFQQLAISNYPFFTGQIFTFTTTGTTIIPVGNAYNGAYSYVGILQITKYA